MHRRRRGAVPKLVLFLVPTSAGLPNMAIFSPQRCSNILSSLDVGSFGPAQDTPWVLDGSQDVACFTISGNLFFFRGLVAAVALAHLCGLVARGLSTVALSSWRIMMARWRFVLAHYDSLLAFIVLFRGVGLPRPMFQGGCRGRP